MPGAASFVSAVTGWIVLSFGVGRRRHGLSGSQEKEGFLDRMKAHVSVGFFGRYQGKKSGEEMMETPKDR